MSSAARRAALVTGGANGIGRATVFRLLDDGWSVVAADINPDNTARLLSEVDGTPMADRFAVVLADVAVESDVKAAVATVVDRFGRVDCVVNNAGVGGAFGPLTEIAVEDWDYTFAVIMRGVFLGTKHGARAMRSTGGGSIVNIGSIAGHAAGGGPQAYSAAKAAVINFGRVAATELAVDRIRVNTVCPGVVDTPLVGGGLERLLNSVQPWPEIGQPTDIAAVVAFLASEDSRFITGESINVDGGILASGPRVWDALGDPAKERGLIGVNRGSTGVAPLVRRTMTE